MQEQQNTSTHGKASLAENLLFKYRLLWVLIFAGLTAFLLYHAAQVRPDASFRKMIPANHEFVQNFFKYEDDLATMGNAIRVSVETTDGTIFEAEFQELLREVTDELSFVRGVNRSGMRSIWTPNVRWSEVTEEGFVGGPVIPDTYDGSEESLEQLRQNILRSGTVGDLVANNFRSALIYVPLNEIDPETGERLDYHEFGQRLERDIRERFESDTINIQIVGFAKVVGDLIDGAMLVGGFFILAMFITLGMLFLYSRCLRSSLVVLLCSIVAVIWQLGIIKLIGSGINPYSMLVPFLVFAIGVSHGVQIINAVMANRADGEDKINAARLAFRGLYVAGLTALASDAIGFTTLMVIDVEVIKELAIAASIGVAVIVLTNLGLLPILTSYLDVSKGGVAYLQKVRKGSHPVLTLFGRFTQPKWAMGAVAVALMMTVWGVYQSQNLQIGDLDSGAPELRADSRYNLDNAFQVENYSASTDIFVVMVETAPGQCIDYKNMALMDRFQWHMENVPGVQSVRSIVYVSKLGMAGINEGNLKWGSVNRDNFVINASIGQRPSGLFNGECSMAPVILYLNDHKADTLNRVVDEVRAFASQFPTEDVEFLMAAGNAGIEAATNKVIEDAQFRMLMWVYGVVIALCLITFRSIRTVICIVLPLMFTTVMSQALMAKLGIGVKVATLPVIALGVGIGVDYGIYIYSKIREALNQGMELAESYLYALSKTGKAVGFTGLTLAIGVATWMWSPIQFQADMGLLLTFMFLWNMLGALILIPALACLFRVGPKSEPKALGSNN
ncbi:RND family transporter [Aliidiomarina halalkaliphila]|uniref:RND family transporter n=1 Tax=Aliidiomarina halalkaliphila TaxID=2593535 RepID=A0A552X5G0_9GAMM|nr:MMPL family transporter [Aliidiomarina halalkaliphila]TRW49833.1 RND family transporter [Aliidiomarina halalkaliphila]